MILHEDILVIFYVFLKFSKINYVLMVDFRKSEQRQKISKNHLFWS